MKKEKLKVGDKVFYYDGLTQWDIEEVTTIEGKVATLSNNAQLYIKPNSDDTFNRVEVKGLPKRPDSVISRATEENIKLRSAIVSYRKLENQLFKIKQDILDRIDIKQWQYWSEEKQDMLIHLASSIAKALKN